MPSSSRSLGEAASYTPSSSTISVPTRPQNCSRVCQSRPFARQPGGLQREHGADAALTDRGQKLLEAGPPCAPARSAKIIVDHLDIGPPQPTGPLGQGVLSALASPGSARPERPLTVGHRQ